MNSIFIRGLSHFGIWMVVVVCLAITAGGCKPKPTAAAGGASGAMPPAIVTVAQPVQKELVDWDEYPGRLEAVDMVEIRARVTGYLQSAPFKDGAEVKKGDLLFVIDPRPYQAEVDRAQAMLQQANTRLELASNEFTRAEKLLQSKAISEEEADTRNKARRDAESGIASARASMEMAKLNLDYTRVVAPIDGRLGRKMVTEGNLINGGGGTSTLLTTIVSLDPIYCYFEPDERAVLNYQQMARAGKNASMRDGKVPCELELANEKGFPHKGVLDFLDNQVDPSTSTLRIRGVFSNPPPDRDSGSRSHAAPDRILQPGFFGRVRVPASPKYLATLIPEAAVGTDQGQKIVYVVNDKHEVEYRAVALGPLADGMRVVRSGVNPNDSIVVNGLMRVRPGAKVNPVHSDAAPQAAEKSDKSRSALNGEAAHAKSSK